MTSLEIISIFFFCSRKSGNFWLICMSYCISVSIYGVWSGLFGVILKDTLSEVLTVQIKPLSLISDQFNTTSINMTYIVCVKYNTESHNEKCQKNNKMKE